MVYMNGGRLNGYGRLDGVYVTGGGMAWRSLGEMGILNQENQETCHNKMVNDFQRTGYLVSKHLLTTALVFLDHSKYTKF